MNISLTRSLGVALVAVFATVAAKAQEIVISNGGIYVGCGASIVDTGAGPGDYGNNENITFTVCPDFDAGETVVTIDFAVFNLGPGDYMNIYQGTNTLFPLQGTYTGFELNGQFATAAEDNFTGCLTVQFVSDGSGTGNFAFVVSCGPPCERPEAIIDAGGPNPIRVCVGENITFNGNPSIFADGTSLASYNWTFGDGTSDNSSGMIVSHSYDTPGEYRVQLYLTDDNDCNSINLPDVQIFVGTTPSFDGSTPSLEICLGQSVDLNGVVTGTLWNGLPENPIGGYLEIPDDQSQCFSSEIVFSNFTPGTVIDDVSDVDFIFVNMEHSFMGDLAISIICPNGQAMVLHQQGGSGTFLGIPNDPDIGMPIQPGIGWDYYWAPDATNGTWANSPPVGGTLPSGIYSPVQGFDALFGCPLNGTWTLQICDLWAADNGVVFDWTVQFNPSLYPEITEFTPVYGANCDSTYWSGPFITTTSPDCNNINVTPTSLGMHTYTYSATDNHGCTYEYVAIVNVVQGPIAAVLNNNLSFCGDPVQMNAFVSNPVPGTNYIYSWSPTTGLSNPNSASTFINSLTGNQTYTVTVYAAGAQVCGSSTTVNVTFVAPLFSSVNAIICEGEVYTLPNGTTQTVAGVYPVTLQSVVTGCDSIVTTTLSVFPVSVANVSETICGGVPVPLPDGTLATTGGVYTTVLNSQVSGCDSTIVTTVTEVVVNPGQYPATCDGNFVQSLNGTSTPAGGVLTWNGPAGVTFNNPSGSSPLISNLTSAVGGSFNISLTDNRCPNNPVSTQLILRTPPSVSLNPIGELCLGETSILTAQVAGSTGTPFDWSDDLLFYVDETGSSISINSDLFVDIVPVEAYEITVTVPGLSPCPSATANVMVDVISCEIEIPNIFTPNGDGQNELFMIPGIENFPNSRMIIYNRWGKVVYESDSYGFPSPSGFWDGTHYKSGRRVDDGVYFYELVLSKLDIVEKGTITVLDN
jgi:gliding motility-associated-like protein